MCTHPRVGWRWGEARQRAGVSPFFFLPVRKSTLSRAQVHTGDAGPGEDKGQGCCHPPSSPSPAGMGLGSPLDAPISSRGDAAAVGLRFWLHCPLWGGCYRLLGVLGQGFCCSPLRGCDNFLRAQGPPHSPNFLRCSGAGGGFAPR